MTVAAELDELTEETCRSCGERTANYTVLVVVRETAALTHSGHEPTDADPLVVLCRSCDTRVLTAVQLVVTAATKPIGARGVTYD